MFPCPHLYILRVKVRSKIQYLDNINSTEEQDQNQLNNKNMKFIRSLPQSFFACSLNHLR